MPTPPTETATRVERFDPITGRLRADAPRFDTYTGKRLPSRPTTLWQRPPGVGWIIGQSAWLLFALAIVAAGLSEDLHHPADLAAGLIGVTICYPLGAAVLAAISYAYRRLRRLP